LKFILQKRKDFKVIITSASMDAKRFGEYFNVKPIKIPGRLYPV
jgi:HrpA-like RNA helicase